MSLAAMPDRLHIWHSKTAGTSPEAWALKQSAGLRAKVTSLSNDKALSANASGRYEGTATHTARCDYNAHLRIGALLVDSMTGDQYLVIGMRDANKHNAQGRPDHVILTLQAIVPKFTGVS